MFEDQLIAALLAKHNINPQRILDNPLFQELPLDRKIALIEANKDALSAAPKIELDRILKGMLAGAASGGMALTSLHMMNPGLFNTPTGSMIGATLALGGLLGGLSQVQAVNKRYSNNMISRDHIANNRFIQALVARSENQEPNAAVRNLVDSQNKTNIDAALKIMTRKNNPQLG